MYIIYNHDGSIKKVNLTEIINQGNDGVNKIYVSIDGLTHADYTVSIRWVLPSGENIGPLVAEQVDSFEDAQGEKYTNGYEISIDAAETLYKGILLGSVVALNQSTEQLYTYPVKLVINPSTFEPSADVNVSQVEYNNLLAYIKSEYGQNLPKYSIEHGTKISDFVNDYPQALDTPIILIHGSIVNTYIGIIRKQGTAGVYISLLLICGPRNFYTGTVSQIFTLNKDKTFSDFMTSTKFEYELKNNKVTTLSSSSTNNQYPGAKCVWDNLQNVREVAEGKTKSIAISYQTTINNVKEDVSFYENKAYLFNASTKSFDDISEDISNGDYDSAAVLNSIFNSTNTSIYGDDTNPSYLIFNRAGDWYLVNYQNASTFFNQGDVIFVFELDIPDRWVNKQTDPLSFYVLDAKTDLSGYPKKANNETITGEWTFDANVKIDSTQYVRMISFYNSNYTIKNINHIGTNNGGLEISSYNPVIFTTGIVPINNNQKDIGSSSNKWKDLYLAGSLKDGNSIYGIKSPDTTGWTADRTIATQNDLTNFPTKSGNETITGTWKFTQHFTFDENTGLYNSVTLERATINNGDYNLLQLYGSNSGGNTPTGIKFYDNYAIVCDDTTYQSTPAYRYFKLPTKAAGTYTFATTDALAPEYSSVSTYAVGDFVIYQGTLYKCNTAITVAETWNPAHWTATNFASELANAGGGSGLYLHTITTTIRTGGADVSRTFYLVNTSSTQITASNLLNSMFNSLRMWTGGADTKNYIVGFANYDGTILTMYYSSNIIASAVTYSYPSNTNDVVTPF